MKASLAFFSDGKVFVLRESGARLKTCNLSATVKHVEGTVMVWEFFSYFGVENLFLLKK